MEYIEQSHTVPQSTAPSQVATADVELKIPPTSARVVLFLFCLGVIGLIVTRVMLPSFVPAALVFPAFLLFPARRAWQRRRGVCFRLTPGAFQEVTINGCIELPYSKLTKIWSTMLIKEKLSMGRIIVGTEVNRVLVPSTSDSTGNRFLNEILNRLENTVKAEHHVSAVSNRYCDIPQGVLDIIRESATEGKNECYLFRGPLIKFSLATNGVRTFFAMLVLYSIGLILFSIGVDDKAAGVGAGLLFTFGVIYGLTFLRFGRPKTPEWLLLYPDGIAMVGAMTGELQWEEVVKFTTGSAGAIQFGHENRPNASDFFFFIHSQDGAAIPIPDFYDVPLPVIEKICRAAHQKAKAEKSAV